MENQNIGQLILGMEEMINHIPDVISSKIIVSDINELEEIHVLASNQRNAKQISRDIQSALTAKFDIRIDHKIISVAQINFKQETENEFRLKIHSIGYSVSGNMAHIKVVLQKGDELIEGLAEGINSKNNVYRMVANAALECIHTLLGMSNTFIVEDIEQTQLARRKVIVAAINLITHHEEELMVGSAVVRKDEYETIVRATLDAVNRRIVRFSN